MIDTHAHILSEFYDNIDELIEELKSKEIIKVINCADSVETSKEVLNIYTKYEGYLLPAVGIHPENIENANISAIEELIKNNKVFAVGEIGLDYHYNDENKKEQREYFIKQLDLAIKYDLPVIIHIREAMQECFDILKTRKNRGIIHCFSGSTEMAREYIKLGYKLGIGGVLTFKNSKLYEVIEKIDLKDIVLETDSPFLSPEPYRGKKNKPSNVFYVAKRIAEIKNISIEEVINTTTKTASQIFDI
ncbi:MAG: TatD family hydrolase [Tenericutes bacterium]|nr:TatD family hydrolase [Mycoplasmatota bacterium]